MTKFKALLVTDTEDGFVKEIVQRDLEDLPDNEVLVRVCYSSLNYKDALSASGHKGITRKFPHTPGVDAAGLVVSDKTGQWQAGEQVVVIGYDLGMNTSGGFAEYISVPANWPIALPAGLTLKESMVYGTAGATAAYCLEKLMANGLKPESGPVLVTGATGGVGSIAVALLAHLGYEVAAGTGKTSARQWLTELGAAQVLDRNELSAENPRELLKQRWAAAIDTVAGTTLDNIIKSLKFNGSVAMCGMITGTEMNATVFPFILRGINILGIASADAGRQDRERVFAKLSGPWKLSGMAKMAQVSSLYNIPGHIDRMLTGTQGRRVVVDLSL
jgi:putative YhdH/YhfP family quinone oxidoreductase